MTNKGFFPLLKTSVLCFTLFLFPLFFLPITQEFFTTNKLYLFAFGGLLLLLISTVEFILSKKLTWQNNIFDKLVFLFLLTVGLSIVISSPNKIQALVSPNFGFLVVASLSVMYFYLSRLSEEKKHLLNVLLSISSLLLSLITIVFYFQPFKSITLSPTFQFLKNPAFNTLGSQIDLAIVLGFFVLYAVTQIITNEEKKKRASVLSVFVLISGLLALGFTIYTLLKPTALANQLTLIIPPFNLSWYASVETLKNPISALFGVGVDNFASMFTRVKDVLYNQSSLWQINSFTTSRSAILHIFTETGLFGITAFSLLLFTAFKKLFSVKQFTFEAVGFGFVVLMMGLFPPSLPLFFLFFLMLSLLAKDLHHGEKSFDMNEMVPFYLGFIVLSVVVIGAAGYFIGRNYVSEYYYKRALDGIVKNNLKDLYDNQRQAILLNGFIERYRINFSQTNLLIANNIADRATTNQTDTGSKPQISEQDRQTITQAIQAGIAEAKAAVALNPQKATNWENLAVIYRNILNVAQGADAWTTSAYQRAIVLDPQNPMYRLSLGGVFYSLNSFDQALTLFEQAVTLKPDWSNAHYNLAWASYQKNDYQRAVSEMQNVLSLLNPQKDKNDYQKAQKDLEEFKKKLPQSQEQTKPTENQQSGQLTLPTPQPTIEPKIKLPKEASPEAK
jgi:tetratricopeptide (TPR) repeat protein